MSCFFPIEKYILTSVDKMDPESNILQKIKAWMKPESNGSIVPITLSPLEKEQYALIQRVLELEKNMEPISKIRSIPFSWEPR